MRRALPPLVLVVALIYASAAVAAPTTASFSLRIDANSYGTHTVVTGTGQIDDTKRLSSFDYGVSSFRVTAVISSVPVFSVYARRANRPQDPWGITSLDATDPLIDPGLALRLTSFPRRAVGTARMDGVQTTKYTVAVPYPEASLFTPTFVTPITGARSVTAWIDASGAVHLLHAVITVPGRTTVIDERLTAFGAPVHLSRPITNPPEEPPVRANLAEAVLEYAFVPIEYWFGDHHSYTGMTAYGIRLHDDPRFPPEATVVRASATTYCVQATVSGVTAHQNGPKAPYASGPC